MTVSLGQRFIKSDSLQPLCSGTKVSPSRKAGRQRGSGGGDTIVTEGLLGQEATQLQAVVVHRVMTLELKQAVQLHRHFPGKHTEHLSLHRRSVACEINTACDISSLCCPLVLELHSLSSLSRQTTDQGLKKERILPRP